MLLLSYLPVLRLAGLSLHIFKETAQFPGGVRAALSMRPICGDASDMIPISPGEVSGYVLKTRLPFGFRNPERFLRPALLHMSVQGVLTVLCGFIPPGFHLIEVLSCFAHLILRGIGRKHGGNRCRLAGVCRGTPNRLSDAWPAPRRFRRSDKAVRTEIRGSASDDPAPRGRYIPTAIPRR